MGKDSIHRHHLLEIILWPNEDGTFRKILNSRKRLKELGVYKKSIMTIELIAVQHLRLHGNNQLESARVLNSLKNKDRVLGDKNPMFGKIGSLNPFFGRHHSVDQCRKWSEDRVGLRLGEKNSQWKPEGPTSRSSIRNRKLMEDPVSYQEHLRIRREKRAQKRRSMLES